MTPSENSEVCRQLLKANELHTLMKGEEISMLFFQSLFSTISYEVNKLGMELSNENVWKNVLLQEDFLSISKNTTSLIIKTMEDLRKYLKEKVERYPEDVDIAEFVK